jgi:hypothetical protein
MRCSICSKILKQFRRRLVSASGIFGHHALERLDCGYRGLRIKLTNVRRIDFRVLLKPIREIAIGKRRSAGQQMIPRAT